MASYLIIENGINGSTFDPSRLAQGYSSFMVRFTADSGAFVEHFHEIKSVDPVEIDQQLKATLAAYNERCAQAECCAPALPIGVPVEL